VKPIGYWLSHVHQLLESSFETTLSTERLTRRHWQVLNTIATGARTRADVAEALAPFLVQGGSSTTPLIHDLVARGWVHTGGEFDLTEEGRSAHARVQHQVEAHRLRITEGISDEEYVTTHNVLERLAANLESLA
jgi:DNA-binding MarR family transcriptional regulator